MSPSGHQAESNGTRLPLVTPRHIREYLIMALVLLAIYHAGRSILESSRHQVFLFKETGALKSEQAQAQVINQELREGLVNYRSASGLQRLARERLNLAGPDELVVRIGR